MQKDVLFLVHKVNSHHQNTEHSMTLQNSLVLPLCSPGLPCPVAHTRHRTTQVNCKGLKEAEEAEEDRGWDGEKLQRGMRFLSGWWKYSKIRSCHWLHKSANILEISELYTKNRRISGIQIISP